MTELRNATCTDTHATADANLIALRNPCEYCGAAEAVTEIDLSEDVSYQVCARCAAIVRHY